VVGEAVRPSTLCLTRLRRRLADSVHPVAVLAARLGQLRTTAKVVP
jgi:hypothetical protein